MNATYTPDDQMVKVFDINSAGDDKFLNTLLSKQVIKKIKGNEYAQCEVFKKWRQQTDFDFGFVPLSDFTLPRCKSQGPEFESPIDQHFMAKRHGVPNFLGSRIPVSSQLNVDEWQKGLLGCTVTGVNTLWFSSGFQSKPSP